MADNRRSVVSKDGVFGTVPEGQYEQALSAGYRPATDQEVAHSMVRQEQSGALGFGKRLVESLGELANPADFAAGIMSLPGPADVASYALEKVNAPAPLRLAVEMARQSPLVREAREDLAKTRKLVEPLTTGKLETGLGLTTREAREARIEEHPYAGLALLPLFLAKGKLPPITRTATEARAISAEAAAAELATDAATLAAEAEAGTVSAKALASAREAALKAGEKAVKARDAASRSAAVFDANPRVASVVEGLASGKYTTPGILSPLGGAARNASERSIRSALELAPGIGEKSQLAKDLVAKSIASGLGSAVEMPFYAMGQAANEAILGDHELTAERSLAAMADGALAGFGIGAGLAGVVGSPKLLAKAGADVSRAGRDWLVRYFPRAASAVTGATEESAVIALKNRQRILDGQDLGALIEESLPKPIAPSEPTLSVAPELPPKFEALLPSSRPAITLPQINKASEELSANLKRMFAVHEEASKEAQGFILKERAAANITDHYDAKIKQAQAAYADAAGFGSTGEMTEDAFAQYDSIPAQITAQPKQYLRQVVAEADGVLSKFIDNNPDAVPTREIAALREIIDEAKALSRKKNIDPSGIFQGIKTTKRRSYEVYRPKTAPGVPEVITNAQVQARKVANNIGNIFRAANENASIWGEAAALEAEGNAIWTDLDSDMKQLFYGLSKSGGKGVKGTFRDIDTGKVDSWTRGLATSESGVPTLDGAKSIDRLRLFQSAMENQDRWQEFVNRSADAIDYQKRGGMQAMADAMAGTREAYAAAEKEALLGASNDVMERQFAELEGKRKSLNAQLSRANKQERELIQKQIDVIETQNEALKKRYKEDLVVFNNEMKARANTAKEQADLLRRSGKLNMSDALSHGGGFAVGALSGIPVAGLPAAVAIKAGPKLLNAERAVKTLALIEKAARKTEQFTMEAADALVSGSPKAARIISVGVMSPKQQRAAYEERSKKIELLVSDSDALEQHLEAAGGGADDVAPRISGHAKFASTSAIQALAAELPRPPANLRPYERANWTPTDTQVREWNTKYDAVANPAAVMGRIANGSASRSEVSTLKAVYPSVVKDLQGMVIQRLKEQPQLPADRRRMLSVLLGVDVDSQMSPEAILSAQSVYAKPAAQSQAQMPVSRADKLNLGNRAEYNTAARREAQR
jgi:hypothetical protein